MTVRWTVRAANGRSGAAPQARALFFIQAVGLVYHHTLDVYHQRRLAAFVSHRLSFEYLFYLNLRYFYYIIQVMNAQGVRGDKRTVPLCYAVVP